MEASLLALQVGIIFLPGILWARIDSTYGSKTRSSNTEFFMRAFMFGLVSYAVTFFIFTVLGRPFFVIDLSAGQGSTIVTKAIAYEVVCAIAASFVLAVAWLYVTNYTLLTGALQTIGATRTYGDEDVWDFTFNHQKRSWNMSICGISRIESSMRAGSTRFQRPANCENSY